MKALRRLAATAAVTTTAVAAGGVGWLVTPAAAAPPSISFTAPGDRVDKAATAVAATVRMTDGKLKKIDFRLTPVGGGSPITASVAGNNGPSQDVNFPVNLPLNGRYSAEITATGNDSVLGLGQDTTRKATREFAVVAPPAAPRGVKAEVNNETRAVTVSWTKNTEPDLLFYLVQRSKGGGEFVLSAKTEETSIVDTATADAGGEYSFQVLAVRRGATSDEGVNSNPTSTTAAVPDPPAPPTTLPATPDTTPGSPDSTPSSVPPSPGSTAPSPPTTLATTNPGALTRSGSVDLSGLRSLQTQATRPPRALSPPTTVDPGFNETLPFDTRPSDLTDGPGGTEGEDGLVLDEAAIDDSELGADDGDIERTRALGFLAAGLLATVLLMHVLWVKGEVARVPLEPLPPAPAGARKQKRPPPSTPTAVPPSSRASSSPPRRARPPRPPADGAAGPARRPRRREDSPVG